MTAVAVEALEAAVTRSDVLVLIHPNNPTGARFPLEQLLDWHAQLAARRDRNAGIQLAGRHVVDRLYQAHDRAGQVVGHGHGEGGQDQHAEEHDEQAALDQFALLVGQFTLVELDEDVELLTDNGDRLYVQIKTRSSPLIASDIGGALERFERIRLEHQEGRRSGAPSFVIIA